LHRLQYADEVVVVINFEPKKAGNSLEDKTRRIPYRVMVAVSSQKELTDAKDGRNYEVHGDVF